ncbi:hypothetical protein D3C72_1286120 [compost metagenome]
MISAVVQEIALDVADAFGKSGPDRWIKGVIALASHLVANEVFELLRKTLIADGVVVNADDPQSIPEQPVALEVIQRRHQQTLDQVAMGAKQKQRRRGCRLSLGFPADHVGHFFEVSTWPPKPKRWAERTLSPKVPWPRER